jgi:hypothetical protein
MAGERVGLAANNGDPVVVGAGDKAVDCLTKLGLLRHRPVEGMTLGVVMRIHGRTPAQLFAKEEVADASFPKG